MEIDAWLEAAIADAERRGLPELKPLLEAFAQATRALRAADFNDNHAYVGPTFIPRDARDDLSASKVRSGAVTPSSGGDITSTPKS